MKPAISVVLFILVLLIMSSSSVQAQSVTQNQDAPPWTIIEGENEPLDYNLYWAPNPTNANPCTSSSNNCEIMTTSGDDALTPYGVQRIRPPAAYYFINNYPIGVESTFGPCSALIGSTPPPATMFTISQPFSNAKGLAMQGYVGGGSYAVGSPQGSYALAVAYVSSNRCSAGDQEYGFYWDTTRADQALIFYYSQYTNTPSQINGSAYAAITNIHYCLTCGSDAYYYMYIISTSQSPTVHNCMPGQMGPACSESGYAFRVQVINADRTFVQCNINGNSTLTNCTVDIPIDSFWPVSSTGAMAGPSYVIAGTQTSAGNQLFPVYSCPSCANGMWVNELWLGF